MKLCKYLAPAFLGVFFNVMLPQPEDRPPLPSELTAVSPVASHVVFNLVAPVFFCRPFLFVIPVAVPKVPVTENCYPLSPVCKVGIAVHPRMLFKLVSRFFENLFHLDFYLCVLAPDPRHYP